MAHTSSLTTYAHARVTVQLITVINAKQPTLLYAEANTSGTGQQPCAARQSEAKPRNYPMTYVWGADR